MRATPNISRVRLSVALGAIALVILLGLVGARLYTSMGLVARTARGVPPEARLCAGWEPVGEVLAEEYMHAAAPLGDREIVVVGTGYTQVFDVRTHTSREVDAPWGMATWAGFVELPDDRTLIGVYDQRDGFRGDVLAYWTPGAGPPTEAFRGQDERISLSLGFFGLFLLPDDRVAHVGVQGGVSTLAIGETSWAVGPDPMDLDSGAGIRSAAMLGRGHLLLVDQSGIPYIYSASDGSLSMGPRLPFRAYPLTPFADGALGLVDGPVGATEAVVFELTEDGLTWRRGPPLEFPRADARLLTLDDGSVLVGGGIDPDGDIVAEYERLEVGSDRFESAGTACVPARVPLLAEVDGQVYRVGGGLARYVRSEKGAFVPVGQVERWLGPE